VYGIYCEHFWYHNDSRQFRCHPWLMWSNISHSSDVPGPLNTLRQQRYKRNCISVVAANGTETKTTDLSPSLSYIIHRKHKVYFWQLYVYWLPVYIYTVSDPSL
jgi:ribulose bisphosphate carboxylase small subunit